MSDNAKRERQLELEGQALEAGKRRYRELLTIKGHHQMPAGNRLIRSVIDPITTAIDSWRKTTRGPSVGVHHLLKGIPSESLAYLTCRVCLQAIQEQRPMNTIAANLGGMIREHLEWSDLRKQEKPLAQKVERQLSHSTHEDRNRAVTRHVTKQYGTMRVDWSNEQTLKIGHHLAQTCVDVTDLFKTVLIRKGKNTVKYMEATEKALTFLEDQHVRAEVLNPMYTPMIVPPKAWTNPADGGYLSRQNKIMKTRNNEYYDELFGVDMPEVYESINAVQETPYVINEQLLAVVKQAWKDNDHLADLPDREHEQVPAKPHDIATNEDALKAWKRQACGVHTRNAQKVSKVMGIDRKLMLAEQHEGDTIYFPHTMDWRGRIYPLPVDLQPQGDDLAKALLKFEERKELGEDGWTWLRVHIANLFGVDKCSYMDRVAWVEENGDRIMASGFFPLDDGFWEEADKPWQALAACQEYAQACIYSDGPERYESNLIVAVDGSCNGLQNLSAMLLDEAGGIATNLVPADKPQDIYTLVMERTKSKLLGVSHRTYVAEDMETYQMAETWLEMLNRKLVKRPVMTKPYGVTGFGIRDQLTGELRKQGLVKGDEFKYAAFISKYLNESIGEIVVASKEVMDWLQDTAKVAAADGFPLSWVTPSGLPVLQDYHLLSGKQVRMLIGGKNMKFRMTTATDKINRKKQASGMSPNVIHSLDASHMMRTIVRAQAEGLKHFTMVHDSYGCHATDVTTLSVVLREAFVSIYQEDVLGELREGFAEQLPPEVADKLPPVPTKGTLDLNQVLDSLYFFA